MNEKISNPSEILIGRELSAVEFIRDYVQFHFDGPRVVAITNPIISVGTVIYKWGQPGYRDALCDCITAKVQSASISEGEKFYLEFEQKVCITISLKPEDYVGAEAVILYGDTTEWWIW